MRWLALIALLLTFAIVVPGTDSVVAAAHANGISVADLPSDDAPAKKDATPQPRCGHSYLVDMPQHLQVAAPADWGVTRFPIGNAPARDSSGLEPPYKPPRK